MRLIMVNATAQPSRKIRDIYTHTYIYIVYVMGVVRRQSLAGLELLTHKVETNDNAHYIKEYA